MISIRPERAQDVAEVRRVHLAAFPTAAEADLVERLRAGGRAEVSLVAELEGRVIGHIVFSRVTFDPAIDIVAYALGPMAVVPGQERHAAGRRLVQNGLAECHARDACMVVVVGDSTYFSRLGFASANLHGLRNEFDMTGSTGTFMVFMLDASAHPPPSTVVKYAAEFDALPMLDRTH